MKTESEVKPGRKRLVGRTVGVQRVWLPTKEFMKFTGMGRDAINELRDNGLVKVAVINSRMMLWNIHSFEESMERAVVNERTYELAQKHLENEKRRAGL
ncbi:MAG: hypothetical protein IKM71_04605 [Bacteroidaceae bacterium]|nr:hypothetical protein [Bacteroidaceae bacterium]